MKHGWVILFLALGACNQKLRVPKMLSIDPNLAGYVQDFEAESRAAGRPVVVDNLSLHFVTTLGTNPLGITIGECEAMNRGEYGTPRIFIALDTWGGLTPMLRKEVLFHEMGHCVLWLEHDETMITLNGWYIPKSIMYPSIQAESTYAMFWPYYMHELFTGQ